MDAIDRLKGESEFEKTSYSSVRGNDIGNDAFQFAVSRCRGMRSTNSYRHFARVCIISLQ